jgi:poly(A) polymerase
MQIRPEQIDADAVKVVQRLRRYDHAAYVVGGCVRDLLLGRKPKDFDVATSATPPDIRRLFRNCRIIGRRFRLAHIFFGAKIIETSTFRANPREVEEENGAAEAPAEPVGETNADLLIRRDNVFGTAEEDARRRDFTINGLFYDIETGQVIDYVNGMADLEARLVRTIGVPDIRFREDPVRILRAVKFAARCDLQIEEDTYRSIVEHAGEVAKCAQARVSEEFYRLLRAGAAKRSMELLIETGLLKVLVPELGIALADGDDSPEARLRRDRLWAYLAALDRSTQRRDNPPSNALLLATLLMPPLRDPLHPDSSGVRDVGRVVAQAMQPLVDRLKASRRDSELARQILLATRYIFPSSDPNRRRPRLAGRAFLDDALRLHEIICDAESIEAALAGRAVLAEGVTAPEGGDDPVARELEAAEAAERPRHGRRDGGGAAINGHGNGHGHGHETGPRPGREPRESFAPRSGGSGTPAAPPAVGGPVVRTPIPDLATLRLAPRRPAFLGTGAFGRWGALGD